MMFKRTGKRKLHTKAEEQKHKLILLLRKARGIWVRDFTVIPGEACLTPHRLQRTNLNVTSLKRKKKQRGKKKIKEWKLKDEKMQRQFEVKVQQKNNIKRGGWKQLSKNILEAAIEVCGVTTGH